MDENGYTIKFEQSNTPLKIMPKNTWMKINGFSSPCRVLEVSMQSITLDISNQPEAKTLQAGKNIVLHFLGVSGENELELTVTVFRIEEDKCICQIPLYVDNEQILIDKIILEIQKNEIREKNFVSSIQNKEAHPRCGLKNFCPIQSDEDMAPILQNLVAMLPDETKNSEEDRVTAHALTDIPKSSHEYQAPFDPAKAFEALMNIAETEDNDLDEDDEFDEDWEDEEFELPGVDPLALLRYSIVHKFLLDNLEDPYIEDTQKLEATQIAPEDIYKPKKTSKKKKPGSENGMEHFVPQKLRTKLQDPAFLEKIRTGEYDYHLGGRTGNPDKDAAFEEYYQMLSELPPEMAFALMREKKKSQQYKGLHPKYVTEEFDYSMRDEDDCECVDGDESCFMSKLSKLLENKRTIEFNINNNPDFAHKPQTKDEEEKSETQSENKDKGLNFNFNIDI